MDKVKAAGWYIVGLGVLILSISMLVAFISGGVWLADKVLAWLGPIMWILLGIDILIFLPLTLFKKTKPYAGIAIFSSSYVFGLGLWMFGLLLTFFHWGYWGVIIGLIFLGVGVVPTAMLATLLNGEFLALGILLLFTFITFASRFLGLNIIENSD
ncbi:MAG: hypothetical protein A2571_00335 [Candidatus Vogelbacteria bacterium RIFOXYD1_FULL_44_32]|uniref:Uncharacterized protein n=1 Tax=Candidatus Vogelbacteria bacterium RIFOXYD1_FULL_44_32 TaxID=1802438 RepID=A0A1G2QE04_9BACT|nr:MAG: hypothetical protein A2571_00335 [Candidatus Vogelbacteria bacterium RIFOXYD1_FULL_44_32]